MILHTVSGSNIDINMINQDDAVLFWQNGVTLATKNNPIIDAVIKQTANCYILDNDVVARGLSHLIDERLKIVTMQQIIELTEKYYPQLKW